MYMVKQIQINLTEEEYEEYKEIKKGTNKEHLLRRDI